jgi:hypothetical protein
MLPGPLGHGFHLYVTLLGCGTTAENDQDIRLAIINADDGIKKVAPALVHFIPAGMLVLALGRWPYGYYMLLRVVVAAAALLLAGLIYQQAKSFTVWFGLFLIVAIVFNPIVPPHLTRGVWSNLNVAAAVTFAGHFFVRVARPRRWGRGG